MLWAYFDDSKGQDVDGECLALAGSVGSLEGWCRLLPEWERITADSGIGWFHASEWKSKEAELRGHWEALIALMNKHLTAYVGCIVPGHRVNNCGTRRRADQRGVNRSEATAPWEREWIAWERSPIGLCLAWCIALAVETTVLRSENAVGLLFAKTDKLQGCDQMLARMLQAMKEKGALHIGPKMYDLSPRQLVQLQAADLVAFELTEYRRVGEGVRWQYTALRPKLRSHTADPPTLPDLWRL